VVHSECAQRGNPIPRKVGVHSALPNGLVETLLDQSLPRRHGQVAGVKPDLGGFAQTGVEDGHHAVGRQSAVDTAQNICGALDQQKDGLRSGSQVGRVHHGGHALRTQIQRGRHLEFLQLDLEQLQRAPRTQVLGRTTLHKFLGQVHHGLGHPAQRQRVVVRRPTH